MNTRELNSIRLQLIAAIQSTNWQGMFTQEIRDKTYEHRRTNIAAHLQSALGVVEKELDTRTKIDEAKKKRRIRREVGLPYKDN